MESSINLEMAPCTFEDSANSEPESNVRSIKLPNELWLKIMSYLENKDIFQRGAFFTTA